VASVFAFAADKVEVKGMNNGRSGDTLLVKTATGNVTVVLTDATVTKDNIGLFGLDRAFTADTVLIPGLKVDVNGASDEQGRVVAKTITVDGDDLESSQMIEAGLQPTADQVAANIQVLEEQEKALGKHTEQIDATLQNIADHKQQIDENIKDIEDHEQRFAQLTEYDVKGEATVKFAVGGSKLSAADKAQLKALAETAKGLTGYIVEVTGFADSTGSAEVNTKLSEYRAKSVITYLIQQGGVPVRHIVAPGAMGEYGQVAPNETKAGRAENRRVEVKILVNKGLNASN
jgi:outer membrane protein OmpA-like peptidoglycan-associated protein